MPYDVLFVCKCNKNYLYYKFYNCKACLYSAAALDKNSYSIYPLVLAYFTHFNSLDVAKAGEDFYRLWTGQRIDPADIPEQLKEGLAIRRAYMESLQSYRIRKHFARALFELIVSIRFKYYNSLNYR